MKLFIGVCNSQDTVPAAFHWSWEEMDKPYEYQKERFANDDAIIRNNRMVRDFLRSDCDILVKMDIDQIYPKNYFTVMVPLVEEYKVIGPLIHNKHRRNQYAPLLCARNTFPIVRTITNWEPMAVDGILEIPYAHTNLFYAREAIEKTKPPWYESKYSHDNCAHRMNRDYSFIGKLRKQGFNTYININVEVGHLVEGVVNSETNRL